MSVGEIVRQAYDARASDEPVSEFVLRTHQTHGRAEFAREAMTTLRNRLRSRPDTPVGVAIEGIHSVASVRCVENAFGTSSVVWIHAPLSLRLQRLQRREQGYTAEALLRRDLRERNSELAALESPFGHECAVSNDGSRQESHRRLDAVFGCE